MKKIKLIFASIILTNMSVIAQPVTNPVPTTVPTQAANAWYRGGNALTGPNVFGFQTGSNSQIWFQTNGFNRMMMNDGLGGAGDGRIAIGNNIPNGFLPAARLHLLQFGTGNIGTLFRTDGDNAVNNQWQMYTGPTYTTTTEKFRITSIINSNYVNIQTVQNGYLNLSTNQTQRIYIDHTVGGIYGNVGIGSAFSPSFRPLSNLHIHNDNNILQFGATRSWMSPGPPNTFSPTTGTGMLISNGDYVWLGLRHKNAWDANDAVLAWGDNGGPGTDYFRFVLNHWNMGGEPGGTNDGLEIMRFDPTSSFVGIGDYLINAQNTPRSKLHLHEDISLHPGGLPQSVYFQITNHDLTPAPTAANGLRVGLQHESAIAQTGNAFIYNQENRHLIFSTNAPAPDASGQIFATKERMRLTGRNAPTQLTFAGTSGAYGSWVPAGGFHASTPADATRLAISMDPANPLTRPLAVLHMGFNTGVSGFGLPTATQGWRNWMDLGTLITRETDHMYIGLKPEPNTSTASGSLNRQDAVIAWGDDAPAGGIINLGPDKFRLIFTSPVNGQPNAGTGAMAGQDGLEFLRSVPVLVNNQYEPYTGFGDFQNLAGASSNTLPQNVIHINTSSPNAAGIGGNSGLRFQDLNATTPTTPNPGRGVLAVNANGDVIYVPGSNVGNYCGATVANPLTANYEVNLNSNGYFFNGPGHVAVGDVLCNNVPIRLYVRNNNYVPEAFRSEHNGNGIAGGFWASPINGNPNGPNPVNTNWAVYANGAVFATASFYPSDELIKTDTLPIAAAVQKLNNLHPISFNFDPGKNAQYGLGLPETKQYGLKAQDVEKVFPELVVPTIKPAQYDSLGNIIKPAYAFKSLNYNAFIGILISAVQQQNKSIQDLSDSLANYKNKQNAINQLVSNKIDSIFNLLSSCCNNSNSKTQNNTTTSIDIELSDKDMVVLNQNVPNPFAEQTTIIYNIPQNAGFAQIIFYNHLGQLIKAVDIKTKGKGQLNVFANDLTNGIYSYSLIIDGKLHDTKKMVKQN